MRYRTLGGLMLGALMAGCGASGRAEAGPPAGNDQTVQAQPDAGALTQDERQGLLYIREEEKLARDVYTTLLERWGHRTFANIRESEQTHMDAVKSLLDAYGLPDPVEGRGHGEFSDPSLQKLYDELIARGTTSLQAALEVGAGIEELDIVDLRARMAQTPRGDIQRVYGNLMAASGNHLRAFTRALGRQGVVYQPVYLSPEEYAAIVGM
ncbi:DUF2202 domain-containing protein [Myxococcus sp. RHSTA-1-4]|uniref:DUF2202 domain-containing protein n=1 Tax=Myxococcus sp. RHSTA-1-4 TaxID=2874601 RepID=UPI001CC15B5B|nr:DUF2202 domain-containing protein [Myxococcus sp. RHSTA-1-4]MBZ4417246.1 DUF2202 domain-containing protein [Myxococcus sp. RHSTA-1-4]